MTRYRDDGEVQIDNSTKVHFRNAFQQLIMIAALNVGTLLRENNNFHTLCSRDALPHEPDMQLSRIRLSDKTSRYRTELLESPFSAPALITVSNINRVAQIPC